MDDLTVRRRRAAYRAAHRGTKEMDLVLGPYADAHIEAMGTPELDRFEAFIDQEDTVLLKWVIGQEPVPASADTALLDSLISFRLSRQ